MCLAHLLEVRCCRSFLLLPLLREQLATLLFQCRLLLLLEPASHVSLHGLHAGYHGTLHLSAFALEEALYLSALTVPFLLARSFPCGALPFSFYNAGVFPNSPLFVHLSC